MKIYFPIESVIKEKLKEIINEKLINPVKVKRRLKQAYNLLFLTILKEKSTSLIAKRAYPQTTSIYINKNTKEDKLCGTH